MAGLEKRVTAQSPPDVKNYRERIRGGLPGGSYYYVTLLGLKAEDPKRLLELVEAGFSFRAFERFRRNIGLPSSELAELVRIPARCGRIGTGLLTTFLASNQSLQRNHSGRARTSSPPDLGKRAGSGSSI